MKWDAEGCTGHVFSKFQDCVTEALWLMSLESGQDDSTGDADYRGWYAVFHVDEPFTFDEFDDGRGAVTVAAASYLLKSSSSGAVSSESGTHDEIMEIFDEEASAYAQWDCEGHSWVAGGMYVHEEDLDTVYRARIAHTPPSNVECEKCGKRYLPQ